MSVFDRFEPPPIARLLGASLISEDPSTGTVEVAFQPDATMLNPAGTIQGGIVAAMLDECMGPALLVLSGGTVGPSTIEMHVSFIRPVRPGRVLGRGRVVNQGRTVVFFEAELFDVEGRLLARATSSGVPVSLG